MIAHDPMFAGWIDTQAPALALALPLACALFVLVQGRFARGSATRGGSGGAEGAATDRGPAETTKPPRRNGRRSRKEVETPVAVARDDLQTPEGDAETESPETIPAFGIGSAESPDDRLIALGLLALFVIFGVFLLIFILLPDT